MKKFNIISLVFIFIVLVGITSSNLSAIGASAKNTKAPVKPVVTTPVTTKPAVTEPIPCVEVNSLTLVKNPSVYLNKKVKIIAKFDKFSSLGLDYQPALRSSEKYITFLIKRDDVQNDIPLSELKNFMKREVAEKHIDLETDDVIEYSGLVFSDALGDAWLDVEDFKVISSKVKSNENTSK